VTWTAHDHSDVFDSAETRLRLGVADCVELVIDTPTYFYAMNGPASSGFNDVVLSFKWQLPALDGFDSAAAAGIALPSGSQDLSGRGYDPYLQGSWSRDIWNGWGVAGMFTVFWLTSRSSQNPTFEPTFEITRDLLPSVGSFVEYVGDYPNHTQPSQVIDAGATWRIAHLQQVDLHFGFGLNRASPDHFFGFGYSFRLDGLF
jgi:Putative MetA-pathway of phenol degradation